VAACPARVQPSGCLSDGRFHGRIQRFGNSGVGQSDPSTALIVTLPTDGAAIGPGGMLQPGVAG
jgi:hypothetical protein